MKKSSRNIVSFILSLIMTITSFGAAPIAVTAEDGDASSTDAAVEYFRQMRCNPSKTNTSTYTSDTYYGSAYLIDILTGAYYDSSTNTLAEDKKTTAEMKTGAREYALMRITLNSKKTESVNVEFSVTASSKTLSAYSYSCTSNWTGISMTDYTHTPTSVAAVDVTYAASTAAGYDWSEKNIEFEETDAIAADTSESDLLIDLTIPITGADNEAGYKDVLIMNTTSTDDTAYISVGAPTVTTTLQKQKLDLSGNAVYEYSADKSYHQISEDNTTVTFTDASRTIVTGSALIDGNTGTSVTLSNSNSTTRTQVIDLGITAPTIKKLVFYNVSSTAIFGFADDDENSSVGYLTDSSITLKTNWARLNNTNTKNLNSDIEVLYGEQTADGIYDTVTVTGTMNGRYIVLDGNGSASKCSEIEVYISAEDEYTYTAPTSEPTEEPTSTPDLTDEPTETPEITEEPTEEPTETPEITEEPTEEPTETPEITDEPTEEPTETPEITAAPTLSAPTDVQASSTDDSITVTWSTAAEATGYIVSLYEGSTLKSAQETTETTYTFTGLTASTEYTVKVQAVYESGTSESTAVDVTTTASATPVPTAEPIPNGAIVIKDQASNVTTTQTMTVDEYGNTRTAAYTTDNSSIWYLGSYDISEIEKIELRLGLVGAYDSESGEITTYPAVKLAYMSVDADTTIDSDYIGTNSATIRNSANLIGAVSGVTEPAASAASGHQYLGALFEIDTDGVRISADDTYKCIPRRYCDAL